MNDGKKKYKDPELEIVVFLNEDIITLSGTDGVLGNDDENQETLN